MKRLNDNKKPVRNILEGEHSKLREWKIQSHLEEESLVCSWMKAKFSLAGAQ